MDKDDWFPLSEEEMRKDRRFLIVALCVLGLIAFLASTFANAGEVGKGLLCDTSQQVEEYITLVERGHSSQEVIDAINEREESTACGIVYVAYERGTEVKEVSFKENAYDIQAIFIVSIYNGETWQPFPTPYKQYTVFLQETEGL